MIENKIGPNQYKCAFCHGIFNFIRDENWNEDKVEEEYDKMFPGESRKDRNIVCDDCWQLIRPDRENRRGW